MFAHAPNTNPSLAVAFRYMTPSEQLVEELSANVFLREFSFSKTRFKTQDQTEVELADHVVWIDDLLMVFQIKERCGGTANDEDWYKREVLKKGTRQIRDTLRYLRDTPNLALENQRGHVISTSSWHQLQIVKVVLYFSPKRPANARAYHVSRTEGFIHIVDGHEYLGLCSLLLTPSEIFRYLTYRQNRCIAGKVAGVTERAVLGQWLSGHFDAEPIEDYASVIDRLVPPTTDDDIRFITTGLADSLYTPLTMEGPAPNYYHVLAELAKLNRNEIAAFKARFEQVRAASRRNELERPWRMIAGSGCGFLFFGIVDDMFNERISALEKFTMASKYELKLKRHVGVAVAARGKQLFAEWLWMDGEWSYDDELEAALNSEWKPFRPLREEKTLLYRLQAL